MYHKGYESICLKYGESTFWAELGLGIWNNVGGKALCFQSLNWSLNWEIALDFGTRNSLGKENKI